MGYNEYGRSNVGVGSCDTYGISAVRKLDISWVYFRVTRPGKPTKNDGKIHHAINGKIHYFNGHVQVRKLFVYQRVLTL